MMLKIDEKKKIKKLKKLKKIKKIGINMKEKQKKDE
jgi:hypothetical protein